MNLTLRVYIFQHVYLLHFNFRKVTFDIVLEGSPFIRGISGLDHAIAAYMHLVFVARLQYPQVKNIQKL